MKTFIRNAQENEAKLLTDLTFRSKASWGYNEAFMESCKEGLTIHPSDITDQLNVIRVIENKDIEGFYFLRIKESSLAKLRFFFIDPPYQRKGLGAILFDDVVSVAKEWGIHSFIIESDPHAEVFYKKCGATTVGSVSPDSLERHVLPILEYKIYT